MKIYDKEIYNREQNMKTIILILVVFLLGFFTGYIISSLTENANNMLSTNEVRNVENSNQNESNEY